MSSPAAFIDELAARLQGESSGTSVFRALGDDEVVALQRSIAALSREVTRWSALCAAEVAHRSRPAAGLQGLAQRQGHASAQAMIRSETGGTTHDARRLARVGEMLAETAAVDEVARDRKVARGTAAMTAADAPWFAALAEAFERRILSFGLVEAIRAGLGEPNERVSGEVLAGALPALIDECRTLSADQARRAARALRDRLDVTGVAESHEARRRSQFWRLWVKEDGMVRGEFELEPEGGMLVKSVFDQLTHPRRVGDRSANAARGRRFGDPVVRDERFDGDLATRGRAAAEGLVQLLRAGASVDPDRLLDERRPSVRLVVNARSLEHGGSGAIEGHEHAVPLTAIARGLCEGYLPLRFDDDGKCLDLGREERLFTRAQKIALAVRDGGCMDPDCDRPPSWTEAHHIDHWQRDDGRTDLADGILLCRGDHLRYHNQGWEVRREGGRYWLIPPPFVDPEQRPREMRPKTRADIVNPVELDGVPVRERPRAPTDDPPIGSAA
ncbi:DUF222 domain-containing protein [Agromyces sp. GXS1127]|uniref:HNH endonuclease signature motif containing protein n=1 Tax=Agromyces sp. GXS1127 TaxID=3424181 RepID=UPI003D31DAB0